MKVFFVNTNRSWGGGEKWHFETALALKERGHQVALLSGAGTELYKKSHTAGIRSFSVSISNLSFLNPFRVGSLRYLLRSEKPDIILINLSSDLKTAGLAARMAGIRHIVYRRGNARPVKNSFLNRLMFRKIVTGIIANSEETKRSILKNNMDLFPADGIRVLYNGINIRTFDSERSQVLYRPSAGTVVLGSAGRLSHEKGHHLLIEMALLLEKRKVNYVLLIAGDGPMKEELIEKCRLGGILDKTIFLGFVSVIRSFMESIDIFILPSLWEGFGYVTIEAMACRRPVVAFDTGSNPEIIDNFKTGFLVRRFDVEELTGKVAMLIQDPEMRNTFGIEGRKRVEMKFDSQITFRETEKYLISLAENSGLQN